MLKNFSYFKTKRITNNEKIIHSVKCWVEQFVIGLNLCPFAKREIVKNRVRFNVCNASTENKLTKHLTQELHLLANTPTIETSLLIHPNVLTNFYTYNAFLSVADDLIAKLGYEGVFQIASFHPDYQFAGTRKNSVENYTNRSPYPLLHILREASLQSAIENYPDVSDIPQNNIALMQSLSAQTLKKQLKALQ